ncbi:MAG: hypothetical protein ACXVA9_02850 [Bdellovibrionales bacterium]
MSRWIFLCLLLLSSQAFANSQIIFSKDGSKATVTLLAFSVNPDSSLFFETLAQAPKNEMGKLTKRVDFVTDDGGRSSDFSCVFSKIAGNTGSCILVFQASRNLEMDAANSRIRYQLAGNEAARMAGEFTLPAAGSEIYRSSDNLLVLSAARNSAGAVESFVLTYGN